jgi:ribosome-binding protein aMBF1 (putative translation factor)
MKRDCDEKAPDPGESAEEVASLLERFTADEVDSGTVERPGSERLAGSSFVEFQESFADALLQDSLSTLLQSARSAAHLSLADVAERLSVSRSWIHQLERDGANLQIATLARLADALGYDVHVTFVARDEERPTLSAPLR